MKKIYEEIKKVFDSKTSTGVLIAIGLAIVAFLIFSAGVNVGFHKASFGRNWEENYVRNFGMMSSGPQIPGFGKDNFPNAHGAVGKIINIELPTIVVQDKDNVEKVVLIKDDTQIQKMRENIAKEDLKVDDSVTVIGAPNEEGQIEAKFIRVIPMPDLMPGPKFFR